MRQLMPGLGTSADGMSVQQRFMEVIARNLANAETTRTPEGGAYKREVAAVGADPNTGQPTMQVTQDPNPGRMVYDPSHPDANAQGFVEYPNVDVNTELVDLMIVRRVHEANVSVFQAAKAMMRRALDI
ncbi:MAG: flagellar basal body rod protein FlgC [Burkholderiaceae bacterium]